MNRLLCALSVALAFSTACEENSKQNEEAKLEEPPKARATEQVETTETDKTAAEAAVEVRTLEFDDAELKGGLPPGEVVGGFGFIDKEGNNYVAFSKEEVEKKGGPNAIVLHIRHIIKDGDSYEEVRAYREVVEDCEYDVILEPKYEKWSVTDLDEDGLGEATFAYTAACTSDISPNPHKVLVTEGGEKFGLRGVTKVKPGRDAESIGGEYKADEMPAPFLAHAKEVWAETSLSYGLEK